MFFFPLDYLEEIEVIRGVEGDELRYLVEVVDHGVSIWEPGLILP